MSGEVRSAAARGGMEIAPFRGLRYVADRAAGGAAGRDPFRALTSPPYDVLSPDEHRKLLEASPHNIAWLTLGSEPGGASSYEDRARKLAAWEDEGVLVRDESPRVYAYTIDYAVPGKGTRTDAGGGERRRFLGLIALGRLRPFEDGVVLPHERTFPKVVEDRLRLLDATRANLENILLLYSDPRREIDGILEAGSRGAPQVRVEAKPGEFHAIHPIVDRAAIGRLGDLFRSQRPIIADGHHRYTTSVRYHLAGRSSGSPVPGSAWQLMTFANLHGDGVSILGTHRLVKLRGEPGAEATFHELLAKLEPAEPGTSDFRVEIRGRAADVRFPASVKEARTGVARTAYALLHDVVLGEWLSGRFDPEEVRYFKEGTGEREALAGGAGDILFRMNPVARDEFESVVQGGEVFPHKTTYFYPKLWSGLVLWRLGEPEGPAEK